MLRIQPLRVQRDEAIYECTATNSLGEINTSAKLSVLEGMCREGRGGGGGLGYGSPPGRMDIHRDGRPGVSESQC